MRKNKNNDLIDLRNAYNNKANKDIKEMLLEKFFDNTELYEEDKVNNKGKGE